MSPLRGLRTALGTLTILPMGRFEPDPRAAVPWYPWVGWLFGGVAFSIAVALGGVPWGHRSNGLLFGVLTVAAWAALSRLLHWDGLADTFDGILGGHTAERRLEIMRDSHIGAFGVTAIVIGVLAEVVVLGLVIGTTQSWAILVAPVAGRWVAAITAMTARPARVDGLGASVSGGAGAFGAIWAAVAMVPAVGLLIVISPRDLLPMGLALAVAALLAAALTRRVGGYTGDVLGAVIVLTEIAVLLAGVATSVLGAPGGLTA